jgi:hypothetical protein
VGGETVAKGVATDSFLNFGSFNSLFNGFLQSAFVEVVAANDATAGIFRDIA